MFLHTGYGQRAYVPYSFDKELGIKQIVNFDIRNGWILLVVPIENGLEEYQESKKSAGDLYRVRRWGVLESVRELEYAAPLPLTHGRRNFKDTNPLMSSLLVIFVWGGEAIL